MNLTTVHHLFRVSSIIYAPLMNRSLYLYTAYIYHESAIFIPYAMTYKNLGIINHSRMRQDKSDSVMLVTQHWK